MKVQVEQRCKERKDKAMVKKKTKREVESNKKGKENMIKPSRETIICNNKAVKSKDRDLGLKSRGVQSEGSKF